MGYHLSEYYLLKEVGLQVILLFPPHIIKGGTGGLSGMPKQLKCLQDFAFNIMESDWNLPLFP